MKRLLIFLFAASSLTAVGQVPEYVPADGLVAWYPLDGNGLDAGPSGLNGTEYGSVPTDSRNGEANAAILLDGESHINLGDSPSLNPEDALTFSAWFRLDEPNAETGSSTILGRNTNGSATNRYCYYFSVVYMDGESKLSFGLENDSNGYPLLIFDVPATINLDQWHHYAATYSSTSGLMKVYLDGMFVSDWNVGPIAVNQILTPTLIGFYRPNGDHSFTGAIDDLGIWNRALVDDEILTLFAEGSAVFGCTDISACNFNAEANLEDETCHFLCQYCKEGTVWDEAIQGCVVANPADINFDGCVQLNDLLDLLSAYGNCSAEESVWQCGDPLEYQGYDYETVQIGEQCWFAENLKKLDFVFPGNDDKSISEPRAYVQGYNGYDVEEAILSDNFHEYGVLYNYPAVLNESLCPSGWSPGTDQDWIDLVVTLGVDSVEANTYTCCDGEEYRGDVADLLKDESWQGGINTSGFSALPAGFVRANGGGSFSHLGTNGYFWTTSEAVEEYLSQGMLEETAMIHYLFSGVSGVGRIVTNRAQAFSVRCLKNAE